MSRFAKSFSLKSSAALGLVAVLIALGSMSNTATAQRGSSWSSSWSSGASYSYGNGGFQRTGWNNSQQRAVNYHTNRYGVTNYGGIVRGNQRGYRNGYSNGYSNGRGFFGGSYNNNYGRNYGGYFG